MLGGRPHPGEEDHGEEDGYHQEGEPICWPSPQQGGDTAQAAW